MKKLLAFLCALTLMLSLGVTAYAEDIQTFDGQSGTMNEGYEHTQTITTVVPHTTWTLIIPADYEIPYDQTTPRVSMPGRVEVKDAVNLPSGYKIVAKIDYYGILKNSTGDRILYTLYQNNHYYSDGNVGQDTVGKHPEDPEAAWKIPEVALYDRFYSELEVQIDQWNVEPGTYQEIVIFYSYMTEK